MIIQCAWCLKILGEKDPVELADITHTICEECMYRIIKQNESKKGKES